MNDLGNSRGNENNVATQERKAGDTLAKAAREYDFEKEDLSRKNGEQRRNGNRTFGDPLRSHKSTNVYDKFAFIDEVNAGEYSSLEVFINIQTTDGGKFAEEDVRKRNRPDNEEDDFTDVDDEVYGEDSYNAYVMDAVRREFVATRRASSAARRPLIQTDERRRRSIIEDLMKVYK